MANKTYPGGFRLTLEKAKELAVQEFGTSRGLSQEDGLAAGVFQMKLGALTIQICPDIGGSGCIRLTVSMRDGNGYIFQLHDRETLERCYAEENKYRRLERREAFES